MPDMRNETVLQRLAEFLGCQEMDSGEEKTGELETGLRTDYIMHIVVRHRLCGRVQRYKYNM
jgi:hypothetical protein